MIKNIQKTITIILLLNVILFISCITLYIKVNEIKKEEKVIITELELRSQRFTLLEPCDGIWDAMTYYGISKDVQPIVYCQAILESSMGKTSNNNLFGICVNGKPVKYNYWWESVEDYYNRIYSKYNGKTSYYTFLKNLPYATSPNYINKIYDLMDKFNF